MIACGLWFSNGYEIWAGFAALFGGLFVGFLVTHRYLMHRMALEPERWIMRSIWYECAYENMSRLRDQIQPVIGFIPFIWVVLMKNFVPHVLIVQFINLCASSNGAGNYEVYAIRRYELLGLLCFTFAIFLCFVGLLVPEVYEPLALPQTKVLLSGVTSTENDEFEDNESEDNEIIGR